jgi:hypothetical protein
MREECEVRIRCILVMLTVGADEDLLDHDASAVSCTTRLYCAESTPSPSSNTEKARSLLAWYRSVHPASPCWCHAQRSKAGPFLYKTRIVELASVNKSSMILRGSSCISFSSKSRAIDSWFTISTTELPVNAAGYKQRLRARPTQPATYSRRLPQDPLHVRQARSAPPPVV